MAEVMSDERWRPSKTRRQGEAERISAGVAAEVFKLVDREPRARVTYVRFRIFSISVKSLLNNALLEFDSFYNAA